MLRLWTRDPLKVQKLLYFSARVIEVSTRFLDYFLFLQEAKNATNDIKLVNANKQCIIAASNMDNFVTARANMSAEDSFL